MCKRSKVALFDVLKNEKIITNCKSWDCPECSPRKSAALKKNIHEVCKNWQHQRLLTITARTYNLPPRLHYILMQETWRRLIIFIRRYWKFSNSQRNVKYIKINEMHQSGYTHYHIAIDEFLPQNLLYREINRIAKEVFSNYVIIREKQVMSVNIKKLKSSKNTARYLAKYITKHTEVSNAESSKATQKRKKPFARYYSKSANVSFFKAEKEERQFIIAINKAGKFYLNLSFIAQLHVSSDNSGEYSEFIREKKEEFRKWLE